MAPVPAADLRRNLATWAIPGELLPFLGAALCGVLPAEAYDPDFHGQRLTTTYLDTQRLALRRARRQGKRYLTLRIRYYQPTRLFALSAKTEATKVRAEVAPAVARDVLAGDRDALAAHLPAELVARLAELVNDAPLVPVAEVHCRRFAREDGRDRLTLDTAVHTDNGLCLPFGVLEFKSAATGAAWPSFLGELCLRPAKVSKFLWATQGAH